MKIYCTTPSNKPNRYYHVTEADNVPNIMQTGLQPNNGSRSQLIGESNVGIYLFPTFEYLEDGVCNWLGDKFPDDIELVVLQIDLPADFPISESSVDYEVISYVPIPSKYITQIFYDLI